MSGEILKHRLAAILAADVAGYSRLMAADERATVAGLDAARAVFREHIESAQGRVIDMAGDSVLAVFETAAGAVSVALAIQQALDATSHDVAEDRRMRFRIGVHVGDIFEKPDGTVYGDGVNIAARLEGLAEPGGVSISDAVRSFVSGKIAAAFQDQGEQSVKNIAEPVRAFRVRPEGSAESKPTPTPKVGEIDLSLPDKPSIAVMPFTNMSGDPEQDVFVDGLTEGLITTLSKAAGLFVIARNSTFTYKGRAVNVQQVAAELGVGHVLEGSVQRMGKRMRINAQLIDGRSGRHVWAERYDRDVDDLFVLQDDITLNILTACQVSLTEGEQARIYLGSKTQVNLAAVEIDWQAMSQFRKFNKADNAAARSLTERAIAMDGETATRLGFLGLTHMMDARAGWSADRETSLDIAQALGRRAEQLDPAGNMYSGSVLSNVANLRGQHAEAVRLAQAVVDLEPSGADAWYNLGILLNYAGQPERGAAALEKAMRLSPVYPIGYLYMLGMSRFLLRQDRDAVAAFDACAKRTPGSRTNHVWLAIVHADAGRLADARACAERALQLDPEVTIEHWMRSEAFGDDAVVQRIRAAMQAAGFAAR